MSQLTQFPQSISSLPGRPSRVASTLCWMMLLFSVAIAVYGATYFLAMPDNPHFTRYIFRLRLHIA